jgi:hypothetical protein
MPKLLFLAFVAFSLAPARVRAEANPNAPLDRPYTLRNFRPFLLEEEYHRMIGAGGPRSFIFPRPCFSDLDSSRICEEPGHFRYPGGVGAPEGAGGTDSAQALPLPAKSLAVLPLGGYEYRYLGENAHSADLGLIAYGFTGPVSFYLDARIFTERHDLWDHPSYDREGLDRQDEQASGSVAYSSFARYRSNVSYDWTWGRLTAGHDAAHWGPGLFSNLVFHEDAVPYNQLTFTTHLGPLSVQTLYGQLTIGDDWETSKSTDERHLYAHRYEWNVTDNLLLGGSEQLILFDQAAPFAFVPVVPLFIAKYSEKERLNNGNMAADVSYRFPGLGSVYSEFLIDDLQSPGSLFSDYWGNKWGWLAGAHFIRDWPGIRSGAIAEYARVEPWVYTHYEANTSQSLNFDQPLGNQAGPNSQTLTAKAYARGRTGWYAALTGRVSWKGNSPGSSALDIHPDTISVKDFLEGADSPRIGIIPYAAWTRGNLEVYLEAELGTRDRLLLGAQARY